MSLDDLLTFGSMQFRTVDECIDAVCDSYMTSCGTIPADIVRQMLAQTTDADLVGYMRCDCDTPHSREALLAGMARLRAAYMATLPPEGM